MVKRILINAILFLTFFTTSFAQVTYKPYVANQNNDCIIEKLNLRIMRLL